MKFSFINFHSVFQSSSHSCLEVSGNASCLQSSVWVCVFVRSRGDQNVPPLPVLCSPLSRTVFYRLPPLLSLARSKLGDSLNTSKARSRAILRCFFFLAFLWTVSSLVSLTRVFLTVDCKQNHKDCNLFLPANKTAQLFLWVKSAMYD